MNNIELENERRGRKKERGEVQRKINFYFWMT